MFVDATPTSIAIVTPYRTFVFPLVLSPIYEAELIAVLWAMEWVARSGLFYVRIFTDNLSVLFNMRSFLFRTTPVPLPRLLPWLTLIDTWGITLDYIPSTENPADAPSRGIYLR